MKKVWVLEKRAEDGWTKSVAHANYYKFCSMAIPELRDADNTAISALKEAIVKESPNGTMYSEETKARFRETHNGVFSSYRVVEGQIPDDSKDYDRYVDNPLTNENLPVYKYLWGRK